MNKLVVFNDKKIRRIWHNDDWYYSVIDVVEALTQSDNPRNYWFMLKKREQDIENPELAQDRVKEYYELKGYPKEWVDKRLRGIAIRQELTEEWQKRGIQEKQDFAILTNEIH